MLPSLFPSFSNKFKNILSLKKIFDSANNTYLLQLAYTILIFDYGKYILRIVISVFKTKF